MKIYRVGILGATGTVGQRFITLLANHPFFKVTTLGASSRSAGKPYSTATKWKQTLPCPTHIKSLQVKECKASEFKDCDIVFSGLDADVAGSIEAEFREADLPIFSNAKNYRRDEIVPLVVPTCNPDHLALIKHQRSALGLKNGFIVTNSNCSLVSLAVPLKVLIAEFGPIDRVQVTTLQAISGGGYPGVPSFDIIDNIVPYISGEEEKMEWETLKILGSVQEQTIQLFEGMKISASCNRVPVVDGHTACINFSFSSPEKPSIEKIKQVLSAYAPLTQSAELPSAPLQAIQVMEEEDRPQPRLDRDFGGGYSVSVGRIREDNVFDFKMVTLVHNTILGAAGMGILNAEIAIQKGYIV